MLVSRQSIANYLLIEGDWMNGGPDNLLDYIAKTLTKLLNILLNRKDQGTIEGTEVGSGGDMKDLAKINIMDILKMLPADRININDLNLN